MDLDSNLIEFGFGLPWIKFMIQQSIPLRHKSTTTTSSVSAKLPDVPKGHMAVYVGESHNSKHRFVVPISCLNHHSSQDLLKHAEDEYKFDYPMGRLTIPCKQRKSFIEYKRARHDLLKKLRKVRTRVNNKIFNLTAISWGEDKSLCHNLGNQLSPLSYFGPTIVNFGPTLLDATTDKSTNFSDQSPYIKVRELVCKCKFLSSHYISLEACFQFLAAPKVKEKFIDHEESSQDNL
ncbi:hypothetical protein RND71_035611 [Anisodus tanguticus]|uniref:Uncharacterized protein n=1 Tax=Anisodus tanguticus TaxID=243964 RepID=A0AAE1R5C4_9SOLA|nr:hypothetical protein RND71_035611 [Anisodus tanguticus]